MPLFLCPCCGGAYRVPLAFCESILDHHRAAGWGGEVGPATCLHCLEPVAAGAAVFTRGGHGLTSAGQLRPLTDDEPAVVVEVATWAGDGSIYRVRLASGDEVYLPRGRLTPRRVDGYYLQPGPPAEPPPGTR